MEIFKKYLPVEVNTINIKPKRFHDYLKVKVKKGIQEYQECRILNTIIYLTTDNRRHILFSIFLVFPVK